MTNGGETAHPGQPLPAPTESGAAISGIGLNLNNLWTLSYIRNNAIKTTILYFPDGPTLDVAVSRAKKYCAEHRWNFSWMEQSIVVLG